MTEIRVDTIVDAAGTGAPNFTTAPTVGGVALGSLATSSFTSSGTAPSSPSNGAVWWDTTNSALMIYANSAWQTVTLGVLPPPPPSHYGDRGLQGPGYSAVEYSGTGNMGNTIDYWDFTTLGNASDFGDDLHYIAASSCTAGAGRGFIISGNEQGFLTANIRTILTATLGNASQYGDIGVAKQDTCADNDADRMFVSGFTSTDNRIEYKSIESSANTADFGDITDNDYQSMGAASNGIRGFFMGGNGNNGRTNRICSIVIQTTGNATDWGDLAIACMNTKACGNDSRVLHCRGRNSTFAEFSEIYYFDTSSAGNASSFGNMGDDTYLGGMSCNETRATYSGGTGSYPNKRDQIEYVTIDTLGNGTDFGDLTKERGNTDSMSGAAS